MKPIPLPSSRWLPAVMALAASLLFAHAQIPWATEYFPRHNLLEFYGVGQYLHQDDITYPSSLGGTVKVTMHDTGLGGFGAAWHFNDFFSLHGDLMFGPATFNAQGPGGPSFALGQNAFLQTGRFNFDYNMINRRLTPFVTAGMGYQYLEVDQHSSNNNFYYYHNYYHETDFTWNVGAGLRWNVTDRLFIKATGGAQWLEYDSAQNVTTQIEGIFAIGWTLP